MFFFFFFFWLMDNRFWQRQRGMDETILIGRKLIEVQVSSNAFSVRSSSILLSARFYVGSFAWAGRREA